MRVRKIIERLASADYSFEPVSAILQSAIDALTEGIDGCSLAFYFVSLDGDELLPVEDPIVHRATQGFDGFTGAVPLASLQRERHHVVRGDLRTWSTQRLGDGTQIVRVRGTHGLGWAVLQLPASAGDDDTDWIEVLGDVLRLVVAIHGRDKPSRARQRFYDSLLEIQDTVFEDLRSGLCDAWREATGADWAWIWTYNATAKIYELAAESCDTGRASLLAEPRTPPEEERGIGHYACLVERVVTTDRLVDWSAVHAGETYRIALGADIAALGCRSMTCVPMLPTVNQRSASPFHSLVSLHYRSPPDALQPEDALLTMARATGHLLRYGQSNKQRRLQNDLMSLARVYLTKVGANPKVIRAEYLNELIKVVQLALSAKGISIFQRDRFGDHLHCLASTGLVDEAGHAIPAKDLAAVKYAPGEGLTGKCFAENRRILSPTTETDGHRGKYDEVRVDHESNGDPVDPLLFQPIPFDAADREAGALGVIRVTEHRSRLLPDKLSHFRESDAMTLAFIADQVSPILQTLNLRIEREDTVSVIKHDLLTPVEMIRDAAEAMRDDLEEGKRPVRLIDVQDIERSTFRALNLAKSLGYDRVSQDDLRCKRTLLEGDIIARVKAMLEYMASEAGMRLWFNSGFRAIPALDLDQDLIERAIVNLVVNAVKYGDPNTTIRIEALPPQFNPRFFVVTVSNYGIGIDDGEEDRIFLPNYRAPNAKGRAGPSPGLGLAIARRAMELHGGRLDLKAPRGPTVFALYFPKSARSLSDGDADDQGPVRRGRQELG